MIFRLLSNIIKQGLQGFRRNRSMGMVSIISTSIVLLMLGIILILVLSINKLVMDANQKMDQVDVFLEDSLDIPDIEQMAENINSINGIKSVRFKSKNEGLKELKSKWGENAWLLDDYEDANPIPNSFIINVANIEDADRIANDLSNMDGIWKVNFFADEIKQMVNISNYIKIGGLIMVVFLTLISIFLISNTIRLAVNSRQTEISIMKWVGATNGYIRGPFIVEGILMGLVGAIISFVVVAFGYKYFYNHAMVEITDFLRGALVAPEDFYFDMGIIFATLGIGIGTLGSLISLKRFLKV